MNDKSIKLPKELVIGTWSVLRSEIPSPYEADKEFFHFFTDGTHWWEYPFIQQKRKIWRFQFRMTETGVHITPTDSDAVKNGWGLPPAADGEYTW